MKIAIDMSPLKSGNFLQHRVRGTGFYLNNLKSSLLKYYPENKYIFFTRGKKLPKDIDVVHYPYFEPFFLTLPVFSKNKKIVTVHDLTPLVFPDNFRPGLRGNFKWQIQKLALKSASAIIADSESSKEDIIEFVGISPAKVKVVHLAAGEEFKKLEIARPPATLSKQSNAKQASVAGEVGRGNWKLEIKKRYGLPDRFALYVGDATWNKNLPRLVEAVSKINVPLVMVGKALIDKEIDTQNPWNKDLVRVQEMVEQNKNIFRLGFVPSEDLVTLYNAASVFVMPSLYEGFGLPILEAMSCGCPTVTPKEGSIPEIAGEACRYVDSYDVDSIASGIIEVFNNVSLQQQLSKKGLTQSRKFSWHKTATETMSVYKSVMDLG